MSVKLSELKNDAMLLVGEDIVIEKEEVALETKVKCPSCKSINTIKREKNPKSTLYKCKDCWLVFDRG